VFLYDEKAALKEYKTYLKKVYNNLSIDDFTITVNESHLSLFPQYLENIITFNGSSSLGNSRMEEKRNLAIDQNNYFISDEASSHFIQF
jgi:hypothetical protein